MNGTILGRSPNLIIGAIGAVLNALVLLGIAKLDGAQLAGVNTALGAIVLVIANSATVQIAAGDAARARKG